MTDLDVDLATGCLCFKQVKIQDGRCVELYDDEGNVRQFAVKRMPWEKINNGMEIMAEVSGRALTYTRYML